MAKQTQAVWAEVRQAYEDGTEAVERIAERYGIPRTTIHGRARRDGWRARRARRGSWAGPRKTVIQRLYQSIDRKLGQLEARMETEDDLSVADHERETRALGQLIRNFEKVSGLEGERYSGAADKRGAEADAADADAPVDPQQLRNELAERILRLREKGRRKRG